MDMASGKPLAPRMMAAMAQQDCGQCGYNCADYANAIVLGKEARLNLCAPGGKETSRMVKTLAEELEKAKAETGATTPAKLPAAAATASAPATGPLGYSRENPALARFVSRTKLNGEGSEKETWHIDFDLGADGPHYVVGDSFGIVPRNDPGLVEQIIAMLGAAHTTPVRDKTLREVLTADVALGSAPDALFELFTFISGGETRAKARALAQGEDPDGDAATLDVMAALQKFPTLRPHPEAFIEALEPLQPALFNFLLASFRGRSRDLDHRHGTLCHRQAPAPGCCLDLPRPSHRAG
jgi:sulfite reductase (NADPH) flavoprotein alpha-component